MKLCTSEPNQVKEVCKATPAHQFHLLLSPTHASLVLDEQLSVQVFPWTVNITTCIQLL